MASSGGVATAPGTPRERILDAADRLFYNEGIQAVGMDRLVNEAQVTRKTMYRQFRSKDELIETYLRRRAERERAHFTALVESVENPRDAVRQVGVMLMEHDLADIWRGCPFVNASAEYGDPAHVIRQIAGEHRNWIIDLTAELLRSAGHPSPEAAARALMMVRTGAVFANALDGPRNFDREFLAICDHLIEGDWSLE